MTYPRDTEPMHAAIVAALTTHTGQPRCLARDRLYRLGEPRDLLASPGASQVITPRCFIAPIRWAEIDPQLALQDRMRIDAVIEIRCWYYAGNGVGDAAYSRARERWSRDALDLVNALTYPGALQYAPDGSNTGLDGYSLRNDSGRHTYDPRILPRNEATSPLIVQVGHVFRATAELTRPT